MGDRSGAVDARNYGHVIARTDISIGASKTLKIAHFIWRVVIYRPGIAAELIIAAKLLHYDIMGVDMRARGNPALREPDDLAVPLYWRAIGNFGDCDFVAGSYVFRRAEVSWPVDNMVAGFDRTFQHRDIVIVAQQHGDFCKVFFGHWDILYLR
jgi:hypothetical protein